MWITALICGLLFVLYAVLIGYYHRGWKAIRIYDPVTGGASVPVRISVIIAARNEEGNIGECLDSLLAQTFPKDLYQVVVVDDHSTDRTWEIVKGFYYPGSVITGVRMGERANPAAGSGAYKKLALETGIDLATGELIVTTDADCRFHPDWLKTIACFYRTSGARCIAAPVRIDAGSSFLSVFQALDFLTLQGITGAAVHGHFHTMGNGANLAYEKKTWVEVGGFRDIDDIPSGDDMFLVYKIAHKYPGSVQYLKAPQAIVHTGEARTWREFMNQRIRWASKAGHYDDKRIFRILLLVYIVNLMFLGLGMAAWFDHRYLWVLLILLALKTIVEFPFVSHVAGFFGQRRLMTWFPFLQSFHILYVIVTGWLGKFGSYRWKDRRVAK